MGRRGFKVCGKCNAETGVRLRVCVCGYVFSSDKPVKSAPSLPVVDVSLTDTIDSLRNAAKDAVVKSPPCPVTKIKGVMIPRAWDKARHSKPFISGIMMSQMTAW